MATIWESAPMRGSSAFLVEIIVEFMTRRVWRERSRLARLWIAAKGISAISGQVGKAFRFHVGE